MPHMLGWFALRSDTSIEDAEWLLARAAGFNAGFALATSLASTAQLSADPASAETARRFGATPAILEAIRQWESARMAGAFPASLRSALRDNAREFHLQPAPGTQNSWDFQEVHPTRFTQDLGQSPTAEFHFKSPGTDPSVQWIVRATGKQPVHSLRIELNGQRVLELKDSPLPANGSLKYAGGTEAIVSDAKWNEIARVPVNGETRQPPPGDSVLRIRCAPQEATTLKIELRHFDPPIRIGQGRY
jgi:hypothetical protein